MKKIILVLGIFLLFLCTAGVAGAYPFHDALYPNWLMTEGFVYSYTHDLTDGIGEGDDIIGATLTLGFMDDFYDGFGQPEFVAFSFNGWNWAPLGDVDNGWYPIFNVESSIIDRQLNVSLVVNDLDLVPWYSDLNPGDVFLTSSVVCGTASPVPVPGTILLLGSGLLGLIGLKRKGN